MVYCCLSRRCPLSSVTALETRELAQHLKQHTPPTSHKAHSGHSSTTNKMAEAVGSAEEKRLNPFSFAILVTVFLA